MDYSSIMTQKEEMIMDLLWDNQKPMTISEISNVLNGKGWNKSTLFNAIQSLICKKYISVCGVEKSHTQYARQFETIITKEEYAAILLMEKGIKGKDLANIALAMNGKLNGEDEYNEELIHELESIINHLRGG